MKNGHHRVMGPNFGAALRRDQKFHASTFANRLKYNVKRAFAAAFWEIMSVANQQPL
jgi:hypothetical protein